MSGGSAACTSRDSTARALTACGTVGDQGCAGENLTLRGPSEPPSEGTGVSRIVPGLQGRRLPGFLSELVISQKPRPGHPSRDMALSWPSRKAARAEAGRPAGLGTGGSRGAIPPETPGPRRLVPAAQLPLPPARTLSPAYPQDQNTQLVH